MVESQTVLRNSNSQSTPLCPSDIEAYLDADSLTMMNGPRTEAQMGAVNVSTRVSLRGSIVTAKR